MAGGGTDSVVSAAVLACGRPRFRIGAARAAQGCVLAITVTVVTFSWHARYRLASSYPWQCDEIPLLVRFTGLCGYVANEQDAKAFRPSFYTAYMGALRSLKAPKFYATLHTTAGFWTNLTVHAFGVSPLSGRIMPLVWSLVAILAAGWAAYRLTEDVTAACAAACLVALSPHAIAYGAQARGYEEAIALTLLSLLAVEAWRRKPTHRLRAVLAMIVLIELSLTVYTVWVYWVLPLLLVMPVLRGCDSETGRRTWKVSAVTATMGIVAFMALFTVDRWSQLTRQAAIMGEPVRTWGEAGAFLRLLGDHLWVAPAIVVPLLLVGVVRTWRSPLRWWLAPISAGVVIPVVLAVLNGSAGYPRNFGFLVGPGAVLAGAGLTWTGRMLAQRTSMRAAGILPVLVLVPLLPLGSVRAVERAERILLPDWGGMVRALEREPQRFGPRWICPDLANHWQIGWYRGPLDGDAFLDVPVGGTIEVVLGAQYDHHRRPTIFRHDPDTRTIPQDPLPAYLSNIPPADVRFGIEVRRWIGTRVTFAQAAMMRADAPVLMIFRERRSISNEALSRFLSTVRARERGLIDFKAVRGRDGLIWSMMIPAGSVREVEAAAREVFDLGPSRNAEAEGIDPEGGRTEAKLRGPVGSDDSTAGAIRWFRLEPLPRRADSRETTARGVAFPERSLVG